MLRQFLLPQTRNWKSETDIETIPTLLYAIITLYLGEFIQYEGTTGDMIKHWTQPCLGSSSNVSRCSSGLKQLCDGAVTQCAQVSMEWIWNITTLLASCNIKPMYNYLYCRYSHMACGILHCAELHLSFSELSQVSPNLRSNGSTLLELRIMMSLCSSVWHIARYDHCTSHITVLRTTVPATDTY
jgi:hypothetical protein